MQRARGETPASVVFVAKKIARLEGVERSVVADDGAIDVVTEHGSGRELREEVLNIGARAMMPVRLFRRTESGELVREGLEDYYSPVHIPGLTGHPMFSGGVEPPKDTDDALRKRTDGKNASGALTLKRIRANNRGRKVIGWRLGDHEVRKGSKIKFSRECALQWTMGRALTVKAGAKAHVHEISTRRPIAYITLPGYDSVELPIHAAGHVFDVEPGDAVDAALDAATESVDEGKKASKTTEKTLKRLGYLTPDLSRLINTIGFGRRPDEDDETPTNSPYFKGNRIPLGALESRSIKKR